MTHISPGAGLILRCVVCFLSLLGTAATSRAQGGWAGKPTVSSPAPAADTPGCDQQNTQGPDGAKLDSLNTTLLGPGGTFASSAPDPIQPSVYLIEGGPSRTTSSRGSVNVTGDYIYRFPLAATAGLSGSDLHVGLIYRSDSTQNAAIGLAPGWHLDAVDKVVVTWDGVDVATIDWTTGTGDFHEYDTWTPGPGPLSGDRWFAVPGQAFSQFRWYTIGGNKRLERYRSDGQVMRYEQIGSTNVFRPKYWFDQADNKTTYAYDGSGRLQSLTDPRGVVLTLTWTSTSCTIAVTRGTETWPLLDRSFLFDTNGNVTRITYPETSYVKKANQADKLLDLDNPVTDSRGYEFTYGSTTAKVEQVTEFRAMPGTGNSAVWQIAYTLLGGRYRVTAATDVYGKQHTWTNHQFDAGNNLTFVKWTEPSGTTHEYTLDAYCRILTETVKASATTGMPRQSNGDSIVEPTALTWTYQYASCQCNKPTYLRTPSGAEFNLTWDLSIGAILTLQRLSPTGTGTVTSTWTWRGFLEQGLPATHVPPSPGATLTYTYNFVTRADGLAGSKIDYWKVETSTITVPGSAGHTLKTEANLDTLGRPMQFKDSGGTIFYATYYTSGQTGEGFLKQVARGQSSDVGYQETSWTIDNLGRLMSSRVGPQGNQLLVEYIRDAVGRTTEVKSLPGTGQPYAHRKVYRDRYGNIAAELFQNLDPQGQLQKYDDGSGGGRQWVRNEWHYEYGRLTESFLDRRSLADPEDLQNPDTGTNPWLVRYAYGYRSDDGTLETVTTPNGAVAKYEIDGYGTLYRIVADYGGINQELGRSYFDDDLMLKERRAWLGGSTFASWKVTRNHAGKGYPVQVEDPTAVKTAMTYDALGRITQREVLSGSGPARRRTTYEYDEASRLVASHGFLLDAQGSGSAIANATFIHNQRSQLIEMQADHGRKSFRGYDAVGRLLTARDNRSATASECDEVELEYMPGRDLVQKTTAKIWEDSGTPSRKSYVTTYLRDWFGRVTQTQYKGLDGQQTAITKSFEYDSLSNLVKLTDPNGRPRKTLLDADGRWVEQVLRESSAPGAQRIRLQAEYLDKQTGTKNVAIRRIDGRGLVTREEFDAIYRAVQVERPGYTSGSAHKTILSYHAQSGRLNTITDGNASVITQVYDLAGRMTERQVTPGSGVSLLATKEVVGYDPIGVITRLETDQGTGGSTFLGAVDIARDTMGRVTDESFTYWGIETQYPVHVGSSYQFQDGQVTKDDPAFRRSLTYGSGLVVGTEPDPILRLDKVKLTPQGGTAFDLATYKWSGSAPMQRVLNYGTTGNTQTTTFGYDAYKRSSSIADQRNGQGTPFTSFQFEWDPAGNLLKEIYTKRQVGVGDRFAYDGFDRMTGVKLGVKTTNDMSGSYQAAQSAKEIAYSLEPGNSRTAVTETLDGQPPAATSYTTETNSWRYTNVGGVTPLYDGEGNLLYDGRFYYLYDFKNRLSEVWVATSGASASMSLEQKLRESPTRLPIGRKGLESARGQVLARHGGDFRTILRQSKKLASASELQAQGTAENSSSFTLTLVAAYGYDPMNRRILRVVPGLCDHRYAYDGWREAEEFTPVANGQGLMEPYAQKSFVWGSRIDELLSYRRRNGQGGWDGYYAAQGKQDHVVALHSESGTLLERVEYDPYGKASVFVGSSTVPQDLSSVENPYLYQGRRLDFETGFLYFRNRYLDPGWGRFLTEDPMGSWGDQGNLGNGVGFVGNRPSVGNDPFGLCDLTLPGFGGGGANSFGPGNADPEFNPCGGVQPTDTAPPGAGDAAGGDESEVDCQDKGQDKEKQGPASTTVWAPLIVNGGYTVSVSMNTPLPGGVSRFTFDVPADTPAGSLATATISSDGSVSVTLQGPDGGGFLSDLGGIAADTAIGMIPGVSAAEQFAQGTTLSVFAGAGFLALDVLTAPLKLAGKGLVGAGRAVGRGWKAIVGTCSRYCRVVKGGASTLPNWVKNAGTVVNHAKNLEEAGQAVTKQVADDLVRAARQHGVNLRLDPPHPNTPWNVPHLNVGDRGVHVRVPEGYVLPR